MNTVLTYKGYSTKIEYDVDFAVLFGKIEGISDLVTFESKNADEIVREFHSAVDDYLQFCTDVGKKTDKEYKGSFNVRVNPDTHKLLAIEALKEGKSLNALVEQSILFYLQHRQQLNL